MLRLRTVTLPLIVMLVGILAGCGRQPTPSTTTENSSAVPAVTDATTQQQASAEQPATEADDHSHIYEGGAHLDHDSRHGGTFFMALDNYHHLEGTLERPGVFRMYLYDAYTEPVSMEELNQTEAKVIWGDFDGAPEIELTPSTDGSCMEAFAPGPVRFPVTLTLLTRLPGSAPNSRPELFTFPFSHYSHVDLTPHEH